MLKRKTPIDYIPPGYQVDLDNLQPLQETGCIRRLLLIIVGLAIVGGIFAGIGALVNQWLNPTPVETPTILTLVPLDGGAAAATATPSPAPTNTPDAWSQTGTALVHNEATPTPTVDYCWWQTPSPVPSFTPLPVTPDAWALEGTAIALQTGTATFTPYPTQEPPRAWCNHITPTATFTPFEVIRAERTQEPTPQPSLQPTLPSLSQLATQSLSRADSPQRVVIQTVIAPQVVIQTVVAPQIVTQIVVQEVRIENIVVVTATPTPTPLPPTDMPPDTTDLPSLTPTPTETPTATATATETATATITETATP